MISEYNINKRINRTNTDKEIYIRENVFFSVRLRSKLTFIFIFIPTRKMRVNATQNIANYSLLSAYDRCWAKLVSTRDRNAVRMYASIRQQIFAFTTVDLNTILSHCEYSAYMYIFLWAFDLTWCFMLKMTHTKNHINDQLLVVHSVSFDLN